MGLHGLLGLSGLSGLVGSAAPPIVPIFEDSFTDPMVGADFANWDVTQVTVPAGSGSAEAIRDDVVFYSSPASGRFTFTDAGGGGSCHVRELIAWPVGNKLWYEFRFMIDNYTVANMGGIYLAEGYTTLGGWSRDLCDMEIAYHVDPAGMGPGQVVDANHFYFRMAYRGRDGNNYDQNSNCQAPLRNTWHRVVFLVDYTGGNRKFAWWLNGVFIWQETDPTVGVWNEAPNIYRVGVPSIDWDDLNQVRVWIDNVRVYEGGPEPP